jgi:starch phosphorylase
MKFALNGALTVGTLDGANLEIRDAVGKENFFEFGLTVDEISQFRARGYRPREWYQRDEQLRDALDMIADGTFSGGDRSLFAPLVDSLLDRDEYLVLADYRSYADCHERVCTAWHDPERWTKMSILNVARMGFFSSDRAIAEYCRDIWHVNPVAVSLEGDT